MEKVLENEEKNKKVVDVIQGSRIGKIEREEMNRRFTAAQRLYPKRSSIIKSETIERHTQLANSCRFVELKPDRAARSCFESTYKN